MSEKIWSDDAWEDYLSRADALPVFLGASTLTNRDRRKFVHSSVNTSIHGIINGQEQRQTSRESETTLTVLETVVPLQREWSQLYVLISGLNVSIEQIHSNTEINCIFHHNTFEYMPLLFFHISNCFPLTDCHIMPPFHVVNNPP